MALAADRDTPYRDGNLVAFPLKAGSTVHGGAIVVAGADGYAAPGSKAPGLTCLGRAEEAAENPASGADGDVGVTVRRGYEFLWKNAPAGDAVTVAHLGRPCWIEDDETVANGSGNGARSMAGIVAGVTDDGVWVRVDAHPETDGFVRVLHGAIEGDAASIGVNAAVALVVNGVAGAAVGDPVAVAPPAAIDDGLAVVGFVSAADTVTVRLINTTNAAIDPPNAEYRVAVLKV